MKTALKAVATLLVVLVLAGAGFYAWASMRVSSLRSRTIETHRVDFPIPFSLAESEMAALVMPDSADEVALAQAIERGRHLVESRYVCGECHGPTFGGGVMIDDPMIGTLLGPNLTTGSGSVTLDYEPADWDRAVRHGVSPAGMPTAMPAVDFQLMSDQELSDIVAYVRSVPPVDNQVAPVSLGPLGRVLMATGALRLSVDEIPSHQAAHRSTPPAAEVTAEFGQHLAGVCTGCHGPTLVGGPIPGGDPAWPPAKNLTPHETGLGSWSYEDFAEALREGTRPDGSTLLQPMMAILPYAQSMTETELQALWTYLRSVPPIPTPE